MSNDNKVIGTFIKSLNEGPEKFDLTDEGDIKNYLGVKIERLEDGSFEMKPPFQIDRILKVIVMETIRNRLMSSNHCYPRTVMVPNAKKSGSSAKNRHH